MPVQIGARTHSFSDPTGLLSDCHRRIEMFIGALERLARTTDEPLTGQTRSALESALRYFREAAPKHTADEEESLFPRLRRLSHSNMDEVIGTLSPLEKEHAQADSLHAEVDGLGRRWLAQGSLSATDASRFRDAIGKLAAMYAKHIQVEETVIFPAAAAALSAADKAAIAAEMALRRK